MAQNQVEELLNARAEIDEQLRRHKNLLTVLFTDVVGSTSYFDRFGDTAGLAMVHGHAELGMQVVRDFGGTVVKTIGDSVMADFPNPKAAVQAAMEMQRRLAEMNATLPEHRRMELRIGVHSGMGFRKGSDVFGDVVNLAARITKRTDAAQVLISRAVREAISADTAIPCRWLDKCTIDGRSEKEDIFEVIWTDLNVYTELRRKVSAAHAHAVAHAAEVSVHAQLPARYEVLQKVGQGGVGIVYKVRDLETTEVLALKVLKPDVASDPVVQTNFNKELCLARKITHKNVCRIYDLYRNDQMAYASMEYVEGENLQTVLIREGRLPVARAFEVLQQICSGLREAHAQDVVHRDLKPANVMLDRNGTVKIMDFGIARLTKKEGDHTTGIVGTPAYMSPEQAAGKSVDARTDIYALGLLFYEMVTGTPTFGGDTSVSIALKQITEAPRPPCELTPNLPKAIEAIILKCLQKDPAKRFQSIAELEAALGKSARSEIPQRVAVKKTPSVGMAWSREGAKLVNEVKQYVSSIPVRAMLEQWNKALSQFLQQRVPAHFTIHNRRIETRHAVMSGTGAVVLLVVACTAMGHSKKAYGSDIQTSISAKGAVKSVISQGSNMQSAALVGTPAAVPASIDSAVDHKSNVFAPAMATSAAEDSGSEDVEKSTPVVHRVKAVRVSKPAKAQVSRANTSAASLPLPISPLVSTPSLVALNADIDTASSTATVPSPGAAAVIKGAASQQTDNAPILIENYLDVGSFKDVKWAGNATDTLGKLGFHAEVSHKGKLWMSSYHVLVGPYHDSAALEAAQKNLEMHGFTPHPSRR